jgi:hypothetical protein
MAAMQYNTFYEKTSHYVACCHEHAALLLAVVCVRLGGGVLPRMGWCGCGLVSDAAVGG